jgi:chorismate mutase/prephenate dehydratase
VNLTRIISRPVPGEKFAYMFFIEFDGAWGDEAVVRAIDELKYFSADSVFLGNYGEL